MGKTTNILDLNNRLTKVEKENVAQNSYTSLRNKPKINNVTLTGNKTSSDLGLAAITEVDNLIGTAVRVEKVNLSSQTSLSTGLFDLQFTVPAITGYIPVGILNYNYVDRGIAKNIFISGFEITGGNTAHIYGSVTDNITLTTSAYVMILYKKIINN